MPKGGNVLVFTRDPGHDTVTCVYHASVAKAKVNFIVESGGNTSVCFPFSTPPTPPPPSSSACLCSSSPSLPADGRRAQTKSLLPFAAPEFVKEFRTTSGATRAQALDALVSPDVLREALDAHAQRLQTAVKRVRKRSRRQSGRRNHHQTYRRQELGDAANGAGTTSLVSKAGVAGVAAEFANGALTRTQDGNVVTFRLNALKLYELVHGQSIPTCPDASFLRSWPWRLHQEFQPRRIHRHRLRKHRPGRRNPRR